MYQNKTVVEIAHQYIKEHLAQGSICIDATAGRGNDTIFLAKIVGETGKVYSFDIQQEAIESTKKLLYQHHYLERAELILDDHQYLANYVSVANCAVFNLGYLPKGKHIICTKKESTIKAIDACLHLLTHNGFLILCIYYGKDTTEDEKTAVLHYLSMLDYHKYTVILQQFYNRPNCPPILAIVEKK